ncbi:copper resistance protein CopC [Amycolatopsis roodepoortensis]|uniref:Methionine-rich copper-binding protein CopC n=1 Tax=Amycolatopsis roodepoortensis TaxID=700274 RepID=A0ABR9LK48_9PSEU|nr:copper resistance CopC family protein [Amycolatopsis roodepoortensis]MBE1581048.1 methionine-rich copper-binding protein CopC [Amycolatopsis roodepoortensis]
MRFKRFGASLLVTGLALLGAASPALAHSELKSSDPARGASLATPPTQIKLTFSGPVTLADDNPIQITGPENASWTVGRAEVAGSVVTAPVKAVGPAGEYTLRYKVTFEDTHAASGSVKFNLSAPAPAASPSPSSSQAPAPASSSGAATPAPQAAVTTPEDLVPTWVWIVLAIAAVAAGVVVALRFTRRKN